MKQSDVLVIIFPYTRETTGKIGKKKMKTNKLILLTNKEQYKPPPAFLDKKLYLLVNHHLCLGMRGIGVCPGSF